MGVGRQRVVEVQIECPPLGVDGGLGEGEGVRLGKGSRLGPEGGLWPLAMGLREAVTGAACGERQAGEERKNGEEGEGNQGGEAVLVAAAGASRLSEWEAEEPWLHPLCVANGGRVGKVWRGD